MRLLVARWRAESVRSLLDVGCGRGAWSRTLAQYLPDLKRVVGVDRDERWTAECSAAAHHLAIDGVDRDYRTGSIENLPSLVGETFDMVTCQTVLCHVADPRSAIESMVAVLKPGGLLVLVEPSNRSGQLVGDSSKPAFDIANELRRLAFYLRMERGKLVLGDGDNSIGDRLEEVLASFDLADRQSYLSDKAVALRPPYVEPGMQVWREQIASWADSAVSVWPEERSRRYFVAGGGDPDEFDAEWGQEMRALRTMAAQARDKTLYLSGGRLVYVQSGRTRSDE